ncbi:hypothetical protein DH2020_022979 [Rehmannia glutinosa]|uniref:Protein E6-like n=1 Tax=Rehmannia glutinosa TaxID=99300 RepID=A0ABR0W7C5_REHGL
MATFAAQLSCFFLIVLSTCCQTEARDSKFFSKYVHLSTNTKDNYVTLPLSSPSPAPTPITSQISSVPASAPPGADHGYAPAPTVAPQAAYHGYAPAPTTAPQAADHGHPPAPTPAPLVADHGYGPTPLESEIPYYGLYVKETNEKSTTVVDHKEAEEFSDEESSNNVDNAFWASNNQKGYNTNGYDSNHEDEPQGMSDTRLVDSGKYYYDVENEKYSSSRHDFVGENNNEEGYYYGNYNYRQKSKYEFDSMEEYEGQEGYPDVEQDQFIP